MNEFAGLLFLLLCGHALADGPLQDKVMSSRKASRDLNARLQGLAQHGLIHGGVVALLTGHWWIGAMEAWLHAAIDDAKGDGLITHKTDQVLHLACKVAWAVITVWIVGGVRG